MTPEEYQWNINLVKDRYHALDLTIEQAELFYRHEQEKDNYSRKHYFSAWEEWDYEAYTFRQILTGEQFKVYDENLAENIRRYEQNLIELDNEKSNEIVYHQKMLEYYEKEFLPELLKDSFIFIFPALVTEKTKIEFLKSEYKVFLNDKK